MKITSISRQQGSVHLVLIISAVVIILGVLGFLFWKNVMQPTPKADSHKDPSSSNQPTPIPPVKPEDKTLACIDALPDDIKISQKIMVAGYSSQLGYETPTLANLQVGGIIMMDAATTSQLSMFREAMKITPLIAVDQEGGTVQRYSAEGILPGATTMASQYSVAQAYSKYLDDNKYLKNLGITTNFSPVVDVISRLPSPLPGRMYSSDPSVVSNYASASIKAAQDTGITPVIKHFPGLGSASGNTDFGSATTDPFSTLQARDLIPYKSLVSQHPDVMVSNATVPGLTNGEPAVWSADAIKLLRDIGYTQSVVYTDSLTAQAVPGTLDAAAVKTWQAGVDIALIVQTRNQTSQLTSYIQTIKASTAEALRTGTLTKEKLSASIARIFNRKGINACQLSDALNT